MTAMAPEPLRALLDTAFVLIDDAALVDDLRAFARRVYALAWDARLRHRTPEDNRPEHELVVLRDTVRIAWRSGRERNSGDPFDRSDLRVAVATALLHDLRFLRRITEQEIEALEHDGRHDEALTLRHRKSEQRAEHMRGGAEDAGRLLRSVPGLVTDAELRRVLGYISLHDAWKLGLPYPLASDWLAVCCLEGDALFPLDADFGPLADLQRQGVAEPTREQLRDQAAANLRTQLVAYRKNFAATAEPFQDGETILRTTEGARILAEARRYWGI